MTKLFFLLFFCCPVSLTLPPPPGCQFPSEPWVTLPRLPNVSHIFNNHDEKEKKKRGQMSQPAL